MRVWPMVYELGAGDICYMDLIKLLWYLNLYAHLSVVFLMNLWRIDITAAGEVLFRLSE